MERDNGSNVLWFISGAVIGTAAAFLLTPESGERMREKLTLQARKNSETWGVSGRELFEQGRELYLRGCEIVEEAAELFERGRELAEKKFEG